MWGAVRATTLDSVFPFFQPPDIRQVVASTSYPTKLFAYPLERCTNLRIS